MKDCKKIHPLLSFYIEEQLPPSERKQVEKHLSTCEEARQELADLKNLLAGLRQAPEPSVPSDLHAKIMNRLGGNPTILKPHRGFWGPTTWALSAAALFVLIFINQHPTWRDTSQVQRHQEEKGEFAPQPSTAGPNSQTTTYSYNNAPAEASDSNAAKKPFYKNVNNDIQLLGGNKDKKAEKVQKSNDSSAGILADHFENKVNQDAAREEDSRVKSSAPKMARAAQKNVMTSAEEPAPAAALPPAQAPAAPAPESMDQSLKSLTYSREQEVQTWNGNNGPATVEQQELVTDGDTFQKYWRVSHPSEALPQVDFTREAVVVLMAGVKPTAGFTIHVSRLEEKTDQLVIHYRVDSPSPDKITAQVITHPWAMQIIPKPAKAVVFIEDK